MKKIFLLNTLLLLTAVNLYSQSGDSCVEAIEITAGTYTVNGINGNSFEANCTEYDAANGELEWYSYTPSQDYLVTISTDYAVNNNLDTRLGDSTWRFTYDYPVVGERDISDLDDKEFVRLRRKKNKIILLMYSIVLVMFIASMSVLSNFLLFFFS